MPWKFAKDIEDEALQALVAEILDNEEVDLRDAVQAFNALSQEEREQVTLSEADYKKLPARRPGGDPQRREQLECVVAALSCE